MGVSASANTHNVLRILISRALYINFEVSQNPASEQFKMIYCS